MLWKFKRRFWNSCRYFSVVLFIIVLTNLMMIQRNFNTMDSENNIDPGGTGSDTRIQQHINYDNVYQKNYGNKLRYVFQNKLRKLLEIMEFNLESTFTFDTPMNEIPIKRYFPDRILDCEDIANVTNRTYLTSGWTKAVYKGTYKGRSVAFKTVDRQGQDVITCMSTGMSETLCYVQAAKKIIKEIVILQAIANENVLKVLGFCLPRNTDDTLWVAMVTDLGESIDLIRLLQMSWEDRLRICLDITKIVQFMSNTPYGSMSMNDFRRQQFVLVDGTLQLSDVDDTGFMDPVCNIDNECAVVFSSANFSQSTKCINNRCVDYNEKRNVFNAGRHFVTFLLPHGAPVLLQPIIERVVDGYTNLTMTSSQLLTSLNKITELYQSVWYMNRSKPEHSQTVYKIIANVDLVGIHDYRCRFSSSVMGCTISVFDLREAEDVCDMDDECRGFVMSQNKTWTGRTLVHLKYGIDSPKYSVNTTLHIKPG